MYEPLDPLLLRQYGVVSTIQCHAAGVTSRQLDRFLARGLLVPVFRGVLRDPAVAKTLDQRAMAAVLAGGAGSVVSHRMAIALWVMRNYRCDLAEITCPRKIVRPNLVAHRARGTVPATRVRRIPVTSRERTLIDCAEQMSEAVLARFIETWLSSGVTSLQRLELELRSSRGRRGVTALDSLLVERDLSVVPDSRSESALGEILLRHGLPPTLNHLVTVSSGASYELDWSYPDERVGLELDGYGVHLRSLDVFEYDRFRRNELEIDGWTILNFSRRQVERRPKTFVDQ